VNHIQAYMQGRDLRLRLVRHALFGKSQSQRFQK